MSETVSVDLVLGGTTITEPRLAPGGRSLALVVADSDGSDLAVIDLGDADVDAPKRRPLGLTPAPAPGRGLGGGTFDWLPDGWGFVYVGRDGAVWRAALGGGHAARLWPATLPPEGSTATPSASAPAVSPDGRLVVFTVDDHDVVICPTDGDGTDAVVLTADGGPDFAFDPVFSPDGDEVAFQGWSVPDMPWDGAARFTAAVDGTRPLASWRPDGAAVQQPGYAPDGTPLSITDGTGWLNVWRGDGPLVDEPFEHAGPTWGARQRTWCVSPDGRQVAYARNERGFGRLCVVDVTTGAIDELGRGVHGQLSWQGDRIAALRTGARTPTEVVVYDAVAGGRARRRVDRGPSAAWDDVALTEPQLVAVDAAGGTLHARYYPSASPQRRLLVWVHGGPTSQWDVTFIPGIPFWGSRGWDVLIVDPRGSTGHGREYQQALHGGWGELDVDDIADLTRHAHDAGWGDPACTVIMGGSSGGLAVLGVLGRHAALVAGGVAPYPVSDIPDLDVNSHRFERHYNETLIGPAAREDSHALAVARSPQTYADRLQPPLLIMHGTDDPVVPAAQSVELARRIRAAGGAVELHLFEGEGHGFRGAAKHSEYLVVEEFLDRVVPVEAAPLRPA